MKRGFVDYCQICPAKISAAFMFRLCITVIIKICCRGGKTNSFDVIALFQKAHIFFQVFQLLKHRGRKRIVFMVKNFFTPMSSFVGKNILRYFNIVQQNTRFLLRG
jgi:hypothetical protein